MLHTVVVVVAVLFLVAVAVAFLVLVVGDVRTTTGEPLDPDAQRSLQGQRDAERRVNQGARGAGM